MKNKFTKQIKAHKLRVFEKKREKDDFEKEQDLRNLRNYQIQSKRPRQNLNKKLDESIKFKCDICCKSF